MVTGCFFVLLAPCLDEPAMLYQTHKAMQGWLHTASVMMIQAVLGCMQATADAWLFFPQAVVEWLTAQPQVHWVSPRAQTKASNFFATGISQSGTAAMLADASNPAGASNDAGTHPLWDAGIDADWLCIMCM